MKNNEELLLQNYGKRGFLKTRRERWAIIFLICGFGVLVANVVSQIDPVPYMSFLLAIGSLFILGASADSWVKAYSVRSITETQIKHDAQNESVKISDPEIEAAYNEYSNDESYAPASFIEEHNED